jgi:hypothetical protein
MAASDLTAARLRELLHYAPDSGVFTWLSRPAAMFASSRAFGTWHTRYSGKPAGSETSINGYRTIRLIDRNQSAHRLAWLWMTGEWPKGEIDHINGVRTDNRMANLRDVSRTMNAQNLRQTKKVSSLPMGVFFNARKKARAYSSNVQVDGKTKHLGYFETVDEARQTYLTAKRLHHAGCTI